MEGESFTTSWRKVFTKYQAVSHVLLGSAHPRVVLFRESGKTEFRITVEAVDWLIWISNIYNGDCTASLGKLSVPGLVCMHGEKGSKAERLGEMASPQKHLCQKMSSPFHAVSSKVTFWPTHLACSGLSSQPHNPCVTAFGDLWPTAEVWQKLYTPCTVILLPETQTCPFRRQNFLFLFLLSPFLFLAKEESQWSSYLKKPLKFWCWSS